MDNKKKGLVRYRILALLFINVVINYMDRSNISVAGPSISKEFNLNPAQMGWIFSAFGWTYMALQIPGGILTDFLGARSLYSLSLISWSFVTLLQSLANGFTILIGLRLAVGVFEAPAYPINNRVVTSWFPEKERASAIAVYTSGQYLGLALVTPAMASLQYFLGWKGLFIVTGLAGIAWGIIWYLVYRDPMKSKKVKKEELEYIEKGGAITDHKPGRSSGKSAFSWNNIKTVFSYRKLWAIYIGQFAINSTLWFFLTWFPKYLVDWKKLSILKTGILASIPFLAAFCGIIISGFLSDFMTRRNVSPGIARKGPVITGLLFSIFIVGANYTNNTGLIILFMSMAFFGNGMASITWVMVSLLAPKHLIGVTGGAFNFVGNLASVVVPLIIGQIVEKDNFKPGLFFVGALTVVGIICYAFLVGKIERVTVKESR